MEELAISENVREPIFTSGPDIVFNREIFFNPPYIIGRSRGYFHSSLTYPLRFQPFILDHVLFRAASTLTYQQYRLNGKRLSDFIRRLPGYGVIGIRPGMNLE